MCHKNDRVRERERKQKRKEKNKRSERVQCQMIWKLQETGDHRLNFSHRFCRSVNVHNSICVVYAKFNGLSCMVPGYRFWGCTYLTNKNSCNTKVVFNRFWPWLIWNHDNLADLSQNYRAQHSSQGTQPRTSRKTWHASFHELCANLTYPLSTLKNPSPWNLRPCQWGHLSRAHNAHKGAGLGPQRTPGISHGNQLILGRYHGDMPWIWPTISCLDVSKLFPSLSRDNFGQWWLGSELRISIPRFTLCSNKSTWLEIGNVLYSYVRCQLETHLEWALGVTV